ncbi:hypothetical protein S7711_08687 [Stachybotrys chartarum IBT 7711]|uniref:Protein LOT5 n=1 Tax=Stachybotrys chartarum (strain CBS 109288 / IBT 7711) TaxID=1280523 RepID=A0A084AF83_STACB|nr:hypothetical protein S7711_08687 [Stachybotrys chartarum IBT 7711]KFA46452.1 hypothetical protein S40293_04256 [Stachybotrys chartarum IBT 40293]
MPPTTIRSPPSLGDFTPLAEYQSQTPESFVDGKPVLHFHLQDIKASVPKSQANSLAIFPADLVSSRAPDGASDEEDDLVEQQVDILVTSENLIIFSQNASAGVTIPYPSISIHAVRQGTSGEGSCQTLWMQLEFSDGGDDDNTFGTVELNILPPPSDATPSTAHKLYEAIAYCSNLHPDPTGEDDDDDDDRIVFEGSAEHEALQGFSGVLRGSADGGLPPPMPGSGGWITADNVHEYFDEDGNWIGEGGAADGGEPEELGEGAGRTRTRDEIEQSAVNGHTPDDDSENKRPRVE